MSYTLCQNLNCHFALKIIPLLEVEWIEHSLEWIELNFELILIFSEQRWVACIRWIGMHCFNCFEWISNSSLLNTLFLKLFRIPQKWIEFFEFIENRIFVIAFEEIKLQWSRQLSHSVLPFGRIHGRAGQQALENDDDLWIKKNRRSWFILKSLSAKVVNNEAFLIHLYIHIEDKLHLLLGKLIKQIFFAAYLPFFFQ